MLEKNKCFLKSFVCNFFYSERQLNEMNETSYVKEWRCCCFVRFEKNGSFFILASNYFNLPNFYFNLNLKKNFIDEAKFIF